MRPNDASAQPPESLLIVERLAESVPSNPRTDNLVSELRRSVLQDHARIATLAEENVQLSEAYEKLTAPSNRIGVFLSVLESDEEGRPITGLLAVGDTEFVANLDPKVPMEAWVAGARVRVNDAYAAVGTLPPSDQGAIVRLSEVLTDGRLRIGGDTPGSESRFIVRSPDLAESTMRAGDEVRLDPSRRIALEHIEKRENRDYFLESVPEIPWEKVGGQREAIELIRETIETPLLHPDVYKQYGKKAVKGILLYGPPGCGKTLIGKATAHNLAKEYSKRKGTEVKEYFMAISGPKILNMWVGETERMVREIFAQARERAKDGYLVFIFMDEAEAILRQRSNGRYFSMSNTTVPQFCAELDGLVELENVVLMLTSNRPDYIDPAVLRPGRIDRKVKIVRPDRESALQIASIYLAADLPYDPALLLEFDGEPDCARKHVAEKLVEALWSTKKENEFLKVSLRNGNSETLYRKDLLSGAIIEGIVERAKSAAIRRTIASGGAQGLSLADVLDAAEQEFRENEIFPKSDAVDDWLQLLDIPPENVVAVKPVGLNRGEQFVRRGIV